MSVDLVERIRLATFVKVPVAWPGTQEIVFLRVLNKAERQAATFAADKWFRTNDIPVAAQTFDAFRDEESIQILFRALSNESGNPIGSSIESFRTLLSADSQDALARAYEAHEADVSPDPDRMPEGEYERLLSELKKKPEEIIGSVSSIATARRLLRSLVALLPP